MESITFKVDREFAKEIDAVMHPYYSTKTEFVREAVRDKVRAIRAERFLALVKQAQRKSKKKTTPEEEERIRLEVGEKIKRKFGLR